MPTPPIKATGGLTKELKPFNHIIKIIVCKKQRFLSIKLCARRLLSKIDASELCLSRTVRPDCY